MKNSSIHYLRVLALIEGVSFLVLLGVAMPLKYFADMPLPVKFTGWAHGVLFVLFCGQLAYVFFKYQWPFSRGLLVFIASLIPFGPFIIDRRLKDLETTPQT